MNKSALSRTGILLTTTAMAFSPAVFADTVFGVYLGGGLWQSQYQGDIGNPSIAIHKLGFDKSNNGYYFLALEHPVPMIPNLRLQRTNISSSQSEMITQSFSLNDISFDLESEVATDIDFSHTDFTLYYELLDNWINFDLGVTLRHFDGHIKASGETQSEALDVDDLMPLIYGRAEFELPFTGFSMGGSVQAISYSDNRLSDIDVYLRYTLDSTLDLAVDLGYRVLELHLDEKDIQAHIKLSGPYLGLLVHF